MDIINKSNYKTKMCKYFKNGKCNKGEKCTFAHDSKKIICKYINNCYKKDSCIFLHVNNENQKINEKKINIIDYEQISLVDNKNIDNNREKEEDVSINVRLFMNDEEIDNEKLNEILNINKENKHLEKDISGSKINEDEIYKKVINDEKIMNNYGKADNKLDLLENNIDIMVKYYKEHSKIIKENLENNSIDAKINNFSNYYIDNMILLNKISHYINLFEENCKDLLKQERIIKNINCDNGSF